MKRRTYLSSSVVLLSGCLRLNSSNTEQTLDIDSIIDTDWTIDTVIEASSISNGYLFAGREDIIKIDADTGDIEWNQNLEDIGDQHRIDGTAPVEDQLAVLGGGRPDEDIPSKLLVIDPASGTKEWLFEGEFTEWLGENYLAAGNNRIAFVENNATFSEYIVRGFQPSSSDPLWEKRLSGDNTFVNQVEIRDQFVYILGDTITVVDVTTGEVAQSSDALATHAKLTQDHIYAGNRPTVQKLDRTNLESIWDYELTGNMSGTPQTGLTGANSSGEKDIVVVPSAFGLECLNASSGELRWEYGTVAEVLDTRGGIQIINGTVWAWDNAGYLYVLDADTGSLYYEGEEKTGSAQSSDLLTNGSSLFLSYRSEEAQKFSAGTTALTITE